MAADPRIDSDLRATSGGVPIEVEPNKLGYNYHVGVTPI